MKRKIIVQSRSALIIRARLARIARIDGMAAMIRGAGASAVLRVASAGLAFAAQILLARLMGVGQYGVFVVMLSSVALLALPVSLGLDLSIIRFTPIFLNDDDRPALSGLIRRAVTLTLVIGAFMMIFWFFLAFRSVGADTALSFGSIFASGILIPGFGLVAIFGAILRARHLIGRAQIATDLLDPLLLMSGIAAIYALRGGVGADAALWIKAATVSVSILTMGYWAWSSLGPVLRGVRPHYRTQAWIAVGIPLIVIGGSVVALGRLDTLMVGALVSAREAGIYLVALKVGSLIEMVMAAVNTIAAPLIAGFHARNDYAGLERLIGATTRGIFGIVLLVAVFVFFAGGRLLGLFGEEFREGSAALDILAGGWVLASLTGPVDLLGGMTGRQHVTAGVMVSAIGVNAALNFLLIPRMGIAGAAWASVATLIFWRATLSIYLAYVLRINPTLLPFRLRAASV